MLCSVCCLVGFQKKKKKKNYLRKKKKKKKKKKTTRRGGAERERLALSVIIKAATRSRMRAALLSLPFLAWLVVHWCLTLHIALPPARVPEDLRRSLVVLPAGSVAASRQGTIAPTAQSLPNTLPGEPLPSDASITHDAELTSQGEATAQAAPRTSASPLPTCGLLLAIPTMPRGGTVDYLNLTIEALLSRSMAKVPSPAAAHAGTQGASIPCSR